MIGRLALCNGMDAGVLQVGGHGGRMRAYHNALWRRGRRKEVAGLKGEVMAGGCSVSP
jgi:hypothetical protein